MNIKDRFTVYKSYGKLGLEIKTVYDNLQDKQISEDEAELICQEEYGEFIEARSKVARKVVDLIVAEMELYNLTCIKGFEITIKDIINKFEQNEKTGISETSFGGV